MDNRPIGILDSGVGGLSILLEINKILPKENLIFFADQKNLPYGKKTKEELVVIVDRIVQFFIENDVKAVVIACNTATIYTVDYLRRKYETPIIGTVPVIKTIAEISKSKKAAIFSTPATAKSKYLKDLINKFSNGVKIYIVGDTNIEGLIEEGKVDDKRVEKVIRDWFLPLVDKGVDAIALGCTHYPFLKDKIQQIVGEKVSVVDSGGAIARRLKQILINNNALAVEKKEDYYFTTGNSSSFKKLAEQLLGKAVKNVKSIDL